MDLYKNDFEQKWEQLFEDVNQLNEYSATNPVKLRKVEVEGKEINGAIFTGAVFSGVKWTSTRGLKTKFTKTIFQNCEFIGCNFDESNFTGVEFTGCKFINSTLSGSKMIDVRFVDCVMEEAKFTGLDGNTLVLEGGMYGVRTSFSFSGLPLHIKGVNLSGVNFMGMVDSCPLLIEGGSLSEVDFGKSYFSTVTLRRVKQGEGPVRFNGATMDKISIEDADLWRGLSLSEIKAGSVSIEGGKLKTSFSDSIIPKVYAHNVEFYLFSLSESHLPFVSLTDCKIHDFPMWDGYTEELHIRNCAIDEIDGENFKADTVIWDNVTLDGKIDFTNAQVKDFQATRLKRGSQLQLITTGSNLKF